MNTSPTALLVVDVQQGFINQHTAPILPRLAAALSRYPLVAAARYYNPEGSAVRRQFDWHRFAHGSPECQLAFAPPPDAFVFDKPIYNACGPELDGWLKRNGVEQVDVCGINTEVCVFVTAAGLFDGGYRVRALTDLCASTRGPSHHEAGCIALRHTIGDRFVVAGEPAAPTQILPTGRRPAVPFPVYRP